MTIYEIPFIILLCVLGACLSSFVNAAVLRAAAGESFTKGRSKCPHCGSTLRWFELIPIISYFVQLGRCRKCKTEISPRYFLVELIGAMAAGLCFIRFDLTLMTPLAFIVLFLLMAIALYDHAAMEIPDALVIALVPLAIAAIWAQPETALLTRAIGLAAVSLPMLLLALVIEDAFGGGDIKLMAACGFLLGWHNALFAFFAALVPAGIISVILLATGKAKKGARIPFGPFLCIGVFIAMLYGTPLINRYLSLFGIYI